MSRGLYGALKMFTFMSLASATVFKGFRILEQASLIFATVAVGFCLLRGVPFCFTMKHIDVQKVRLKTIVFIRYLRGFPVLSWGLVDSHKPLQILLRRGTAPALHKDRQYIAHHKIHRTP